MSNDRGERVLVPPHVYANLSSETRAEYGFSETPDERVFGVDLHVSSVADIDVYDAADLPLCFVELGEIDSYGEFDADSLQAFRHGKEVGYVDIGEYGLTVTVADDLEIRPYRLELLAGLRAALVECGAFK